MARIAPYGDLCLCRDMSPIRRIRRKSYIIHIEAYERDLSGGIAFERDYSGALVLNAGYEPIKVVNWQKAVILWFQEKVDVLEYHAEAIRSASSSFQLPSVLILRRYVRPYFCRQVRLSRQNIFLRDEFRCQYCCKVFPPKLLTIDHVKPLSRGGEHRWENVTSSCGKCNNKKGDKSLKQMGMKLYSQPAKPKWLPQRELTLGRKRVPDEWLDYLPEDN